MTRPHLRIGLTGSIGMGKSTVLGFFAEEGLETWDADAAVARLYAPQGEGFAAIRKIAPDCALPGGVDRDCLSHRIAADQTLLPKIEQVIHPLVAEDREAFAASVTTWAAVYDIPLLFETSGQARFDKVVVVSAPSEVQRERVLARPGMTPEKLDYILSRQMPDDEKRQKADHVIDTGRSIEQTRQEVARLVREWRADHA